MATVKQRYGRALPRIIGAAAAVALLAGLAMWIGADDGTKQADLGAGLVSSGLFGLLVLVLDHTLSRGARELDRKLSLAATASPAHDDPDPSVAPEVDALIPRPSEAAPLASTFEAWSDGWQRDTGRIDADQLRIRVLRDSKYFQFFTAVIPGGDFRRHTRAPQVNGVGYGQFQRAIAQRAVEQIRQRITDGEAPSPGDPTTAIELFPDCEAAAREARGLDNAEIVAGERIAQWSQVT